MQNIKICTAKLTDVPKIAQVILQTWQSAYADILTDEVLSKLTEERYLKHIENDIKTPDSVVFIAENAAREVVAMISGGSVKQGLKGQNYAAELYATYILPDYQEYGIGKRIFNVFLHWLYQNGAGSMLLWVLKDNLNAREFYAALGGKLIGSGKITINDAEFATVCYGWQDVFEFAQMAREAIELAVPDPKWQVMAQEEIATIKNALPQDLALDIQHIGSTAIPKIKAKPIIDLILGVASIEQALKIIPVPLAALGYVFDKNNSDLKRLFFVKGAPPYGKQRTHHLHIVEFKSPTWQQHILFRDYLLKQPKIARIYAMQKEKLAKEFAKDRRAYTERKGAFINKILKKAC